MSRAKILVVEDERIVAEDIRMSLEDAGYSVCGIAKRGEEAIQLAKEHQPDLALLDIVLRGEMDGIGVAQQIREFQIPFIFLTAYSQQGVIERAKATEPLGYLIKPFEQASLISSVEIAVHKAQIDQQLQASHEWFYTTLRSVGDGVIATDPDGKIVFLNAVAEELTGWSSDETAGKDIQEVFEIRHETTRQLVKNPALVALETQEVVGLADDTVLIRRDGKELPIDDSGSPIRNSAGELVGAVLIFRDITEKKIADEEVTKYQTHLESIVSKRTEELHARVQLEELVSSISIDILDLNDDELDQGIVKALGRMGEFLQMDHCIVYQYEKNSEGKLEFTASHGWGNTDSKKFPIPDSTAWGESWCISQVREQGRLTLSSLDDIPEDAFEEREALEAEKIQSLGVFPIGRRGKLHGVLLLASHQEYAWKRHGTRLFDMFVQIVLSALQRLDAAKEKTRLMEELNQANKLEAIGKLTGGIAHDFNNMLLPIIGYSDMLLDPDRVATKASKEEIHEIRKAAESAAALTHQLLAFSRKQILEKCPMDLNELIESKRVLLSRVLGEDIDIVVKLDENAGAIEADRGQMDQVIMNLCVNARDAMPDGGAISMSTESVRAIKPGSHNRADYLRTTIQDTGVGMPDEVMERVFDPFFTTKGMDGTGLGLSVVVGIIEQHEGWIDVSSEVGKGTKFEIYLPMVKAETPQLTPTTERSHHPSRSGERILLIEDEMSVITFVKTALVKKGYEVTTAMSAKEALRVFAEHEGRFDLIFSDAMLPDGTGMEVLMELLATRPHIKGLLSSGYTDHRALVDAARENEIAFLHKPYALTSLYEMVAKVLSQDDEEEIPLAS